MFSLISGHRAHAIATTQWKNSGFLAKYKAKSDRKIQIIVWIDGAFTTTTAKYRHFRAIASNCIWWNRLILPMDQTTFNFTRAHLNTVQSRNKHEPQQQKWCEATQYCTLSLQTYDYGSAIFAHVFVIYCIAKHSYCELKIASRATEIFFPRVMDDLCSVGCIYNTYTKKRTNRGNVIDKTFAQWLLGRNCYWDACIILHIPHTLCNRIECWWRNWTIVLNWDENKRNRMRQTGHIATKSTPSPTALPPHKLRCKTELAL